MVGFEFRKVGDLVIARILGGDFRQLDDRVEHRLEATVAEHDSAEHDVFRQFLCFRLDHQNGVARAGDDEVELGFSHLVDVRVELVLTADVADASTADRAHEGNAGKVSAAEVATIDTMSGIVFTIVLHDGDDNLGVVLVAVGEERADRAVDEAGNQGLLLARTAFTLEVAAGDLAGGVGLFLVVDGQRKEVETRLRLLGRNDGGEHDGLAIGCEHGAVSLTGDLAGLEDERAACPFDFHFVVIEHVLSFLCGCFRAGLPATEQPSGFCLGRATGKTTGGPGWRRLCAAGRPAILPHDRSMGGSDPALRIGPGFGNDAATSA